MTHSTHSSSKPSSATYPTLRTERSRSRATLRFLCVRLDSLGDVLMTTPAIAAIRETYPAAHITLLTSQAGGAIAPLLPDIDETLIYDAPWLKATAPRKNSQPEFEWIEQLRDRQFDIAIIFTVYSQSPLPSAMMAYLADIPLRVAHCRENPYQLLSHSIRDPEPETLIRHEAQRQLDLVATLGCKTHNPRLRLHVPASAHATIAQRLAKLNLDSNFNARPWIVVHAGASAPSRRYPPHLFAQAVQSLIDQGITPLFTGIDSETSLIEQIRNDLTGPTHSLVGQLSLSELAALLSAAPLLLSNNTGPVHIAAAVGTPVVDLYALTNIQHTPWRVPNRVLYQSVACRCCYKSICPEGHHDCLSKVSPEKVVEAVLSLLEITQQENVSNDCRTQVSQSPLAKLIEV